jgi:hypothetical protein
VALLVYFSEIALKRNAIKRSSENSNSKDSILP